MRDFTLQKYHELCTFLNSQGYATLTVEHYLEFKKEKKLPLKFVVLRHDVDRWINNAIQMAREENQNNIASTYYFRFPKTFEIDSIRKIADLGHEIGYHYEVLSKRKGDEIAAIESFKDELDCFNKYFLIKTICMHGNPLSQYDNRDLWKKYNYRDYGIIGEAYLSMSDLVYFSDTGRTWSGKFSKFDFISGTISKSNLNSTEDLKIWICENSPSGLYLVIHPERWAGSIKQYIISWCMDLVVNVGKKLYFLRM